MIVLFWFVSPTLFAFANSTFSTSHDDATAPAREKLDSMGSLSLHGSSPPPTVFSVAFKNSNELMISPLQVFPRDASHWRPAG